MSRTAIREYVDHLCEKHKRSGTVRETLEDLQNKLAREVGECKPDSYDEKLQVMLPGVPLDPDKMDTWRELIYVKGFLATPAPWLLDCNCKAHQSKGVKVDI